MLERQKRTGGENREGEGEKREGRRREDTAAVAIINNLVSRSALSKFIETDPVVQGHEVLN